jgi:hypothetical protein
MRDASNGSNAGGVLSKFANKIKSSISKTLGLPQSLIPTSIFNDTNPRVTKTGKIHLGFNTKTSSNWDTMTSLSEIKELAAGSLLGKFLKQNAQGTPNQMGGQILGGGIQAAKSALTKKLFGSSAEGTADPLYKNTPKLYVKNRDEHGNLAPNMKMTQPAHELFAYNHYTINSIAENNYSKSGKFFDKSGDIASRNDLSTILESIKTVFPQKLLPQKNGLQKYSYTKKYTTAIWTSQAAPNNITIQGNVNEYNEIQAAKSLEAIRGFSYNTLDESGNQIVYKNYGDALNTKITHLEGDEKNGKLPLANPNEFLDDLDFIPLKFYTLGKGTKIKDNSVVQFRATISGLSETFRPSWESNKFIGNPFNYYTYTGIERSVTFKFKVYSLSAAEHIAAWQRLKFLASLVYPADYSGTAGYVLPPFIKFTLGDMYEKKEGFIETLTYTIDDNSPWEVGMNGLAGNGNTLIPGSNIMKNYKLPTFIDVDITIKFVENAKSHTISKPIEEGTSKSQTKTFIYEPSGLYPFGSNDKTDRGVDASGAAKTKEKATKNSNSNNADGSKKGNDSKKLSKKEEQLIKNAKVSMDSTNSFNSNMV